MKTLQITRTFNTSPEQLFKAWTTPDLLRKWWCTPGYYFEELNIDLRPEGAYRYILGLEEGLSGPGCIMEGRFHTVRTPEKLTYSWTILVGDFTERDTTVDVTFTRQGEKTELTLKHGGFATEEGYNLHALDWPVVLDKLAETLKPIPVAG